MRTKITIRLEIKNKKDRLLQRSFDLAVPTLPGRLQPSTIGVVDFTTVFEMVTGVTPQLYPPKTFQHFSCEEIFAN